MKFQMHVAIFISALVDVEVDDVTADVNLRVPTDFPLHSSAVVVGATRAQPDQQKLSKPVIAGLLHLCAVQAKTAADESYGSAMPVKIEGASA